MRCPRCDHAVSKSDRFCGRCGLALPTDGGKPVDPLLGLVVDNRYRIEERIGVGGMGTVYLGSHVNLGQKVAIKVLHERHVANDDLVKRFHVEARTYARVDHPNVVKLMHFDQMPDGTTYMVMEYCPGTSLAAKLHHDGKLDPVMAGDLAVQIAQGLSATHSAGIVHRDLKPDNIVLTETRPGRYHVKLLDFGIAKDMDDDGPRLTQAGMVFGTPEYMAPEQARGHTVDERSDIYALGCVLYEMLTGDPPFTGSDKMRVMHQQATENPVPPSDKLGDPAALPGPLEDVVLTCLAKRPADRFQSADLLIDAFDDVSLLAERPSLQPATPRPTPSQNLSGPPTREERAATPVKSPAATTAGVSLGRPPGDAPGSGPWERGGPLPGQRQPSFDPSSVGRATPSGPRAITGDGPLFIDPGPPPGMGGEDGVASSLITAALVFVAAIGLAAWFFSKPEGPDRDPPVTQGSAVANPASPPSAPPTEAPSSQAAAPTRPATEAPRRPASKAPASQARRPASKAPASQARRPASKAPASQAKRPASKAPASKAPPKRPATQAPPPKPKGPSAAEQVAKARDALQKGQFGVAERTARGALKTDPDHRPAQALVDEVQDLRAALKKGRAADKRGDCVTVLSALKPVVAAAPGLSEAQKMVDHCQLALPPKGI